jgi:hypothetical protein
MMIKASGRSALILATGLFVCFAGPSQATAAGPDSAAATSKSDNATTAKSIRQSARHWKRYTQRKSSKQAAKPAETKTPAESEIADAAVTPAVIPASVANANAQLTSADTPADGAWAMTAKANNVLMAAADKPADAQPAGDAAVVASDQLNDVDRALQQNPATTQPNPASTRTVAMATAQAAPAAPVLASGSDGSTWDQTSLIGKIFIGFGALLTMASAARMFMA